MARMSIPEAAPSSDKPWVSYDQSYGTGGAPPSPSDAPLWFNDTQGGGHGFSPWENSIRSRRSAGAGSGSRCTWPAWPLGNKLSVPGITDAILRYRRRFTWEGLLFADAGCTGEVGIRSESSTLSFAGTCRGISFTEAAGVWTLTRRLVSGGAIGVLVNTGITTNVYRPFKFVYTEGQSPTLECWLNNVLIQRLTGEAAFPEALTSAVQDYCMACHSNAAGNLRTFNHRLVVEVV